MFLATKLSAVLLVGITILAFTSWPQIAHRTQSESISPSPRATPPTAPAVVESPPRFPKVKGFVNDFSNVISVAEIGDIDRSILTFQRDQKIDIIVAIVDTTGEESIFDYSLAMAREWKIGSENGGALLLLAVKDRQWRIQIDKKLEKIVTNDEVADIATVMVPYLKKKEYAVAIKKCVEKLAAVLAEKRSKMTP